MAESGDPLRVYTLRGLPPEVAAVTFAKTSRSPESFDEIARELTEADSSRFHEKWVIGYGHSSVAEHAVLSIAVENVSILGAKVLEDNRLSSFTEKSTRYQVMDPANYYTPPAFEGVGAYHAVVSALYDTYAELLELVRPFCERKYGAPEHRAAGLNPAGKACDAVRGLLPSAAKTNLGWTVNARSLRHAIVKLRSHPLVEMRELGDALEEACGEAVPTLLRHTETSSYLSDRPGGGVGAAARRRVGGPPGESGATSGDRGQAAVSGSVVRLVSHDPRGERRVAETILFGADGCSHDEARERVEAMSDEEIGVLLKGALDGIGGHEAPVREFESTAYVFEITCDFGAYRDVQRHRMTSQIAQPLTCDLGYSTPDDAVESGAAYAMRVQLDRAREAWRDLASIDLFSAQYAVPLAFRKRFLMQMNYREAYVFARLRSKVQGHESYRRIAWSVKDEIERVHPTLGGAIPVDREPVAERPVGG
ncbi:MAG: hypothetical protein GF400_05400 [Candidatus Eisenbacteria bacterium]|nr:hypothetical protein [Candidatus Eisenbacteria bacterium]